MLRAKKEKIALCAGYIVIICMACVGCKGTGLSDGCGILHRLGYPLFHQNLFHAIANIYVFNQCVRAIPARWNILMFYLIAVSYPFPSSVPIVGMSGVVYAYMGFIAPYVRKKLQYNVTILIYISLGFFFPCMAIGVHIYCYALGLLWGYLNAPLCQDK